MRSPNDMFCLIGKRGAGKDELAKHLTLPTTTISDILSQYCQNNNLTPDRDTLTRLGNTVFDGSTLAQALHNTLPQGGVITGLRKPETLYHLMQKHRCLLIGVLADDMTRWKRVCHRNRPGDSMPLLSFLDHEKVENSPPNKQNIDMLLAFADIHITNTTTIDELILKGKHALQKVLTRKNFPTHIDAQGYQHFSRAILVNEFDEILVLYDANKMLYTLPGGKIDAGETPDVTIHRELGEEIGIAPSVQYCGSFPGLFRDGLGKGHFFTGRIQKDSVHICEPMIHSKYIRVHKDTLEQTLGTTSYIDTGLYHYKTNNWITNRDYTRNIEIGNLEHMRIGVIQYIDTKTNTLHIQPDNALLLENHQIPLRKTSLQAAFSGVAAQAKRDWYR